MWNYLCTAAFAAMTVLAAGCAADGSRYAPARFSPYSGPAQYPSDPSPDTPREEKRGNTPPGMDRTGGGPASGAILDPTGAVTKEPVLRER